MLTTDLALRFDPIYEPIARRFLAHPDQLADAFVRAWFKLTHRDMGPKSALLGARGAGRGPDLAGPAACCRSPADRRRTSRPSPEPRSLASGLSIAQLVSTAWASASTFRGTDKRGGANGARIRLAPQKDWAVNKSDVARAGAAALEDIQADVQRLATGAKKRVSLADLIVFGGGVGDRVGGQAAGHAVRCPSRRDARTPRRSRPTSPTPSPCSSRRRRLPQLQPRQAAAVGRRAVGRQGAAADAHRAGDDRAARRHARARCQRRRSRARGLHPAARDLTNDFFANLLDMGTTRGSRPRPRRTCSRAAIARPARCAGPPRGSISSSARTRSCARWPRSTPAPMPGRRSSTPSRPRGPR